MRWIRGVAGALLLALAPAASWAQTNNPCDQPGEAPDMVLGDVTGVTRWNTIGGITAYSLGSTTCNVGTCWLNFDGSEPNHPVVAQNMYRLYHGRLEQIGQSWIKHFGAASQMSYCGSCLASPNGKFLGVNCSDLYDSAGNGFQGVLGVRSDVDPYTGAVPYPYFGRNSPVTNGLDKRLQVAVSDLDPVQHQGARWFAELHAIGADDAAAGRDANNWSYREVRPISFGAGFDLVPLAPTVVGQSALDVWRANDPSITVTQGSRPGDGVIRIMAKVTWLGDGTWSYDYAVQNMNAATAPLAFSVPLPPGVTATGLKFHTVPYHSGDLQRNSIWTGEVSASSVTWTERSKRIADGTVPNAIRWGTHANFGFVSNAPPGTHHVVLGLAGSLTAPFDPSLDFIAPTPSLCDEDGGCDPGETCASCPADCSLQGGGEGCCGNGTCEAGESAGACAADCAATLQAETACADSIDEDRDGPVDCFDTDCCADPACASFDADGDGMAACDCNDADVNAWSTPGEVRDLTMLKNVFTGVYVFWNPPVVTGGSLPRYDVIRSADPSDFAGSGVCVSNPDPVATSVPDGTLPEVGHAFFYLVAARSGCPVSRGPLGSSSSGVPHVGPPC